MEYERTSDGQMQADFARRIGSVAEQYKQLCSTIPPEVRYEGTLLLALMQALLTNCAELLKRNHNNPVLRQVANRPLDQDPTLLGFQRSSVIEQWPMERQLTHRELLECLRNAMSHPCPQTRDGLPQTGYTSWQTNSVAIEGFTFTQSPWVNSTGRQLKPLYMPEKGTAKGEEKLREEMARFSSNYSVPDLSIRNDKEGNLRVFHRDEPFIP